MLGIVESVLVYLVRGSVVLSILCASVFGFFFFWLNGTMKMWDLIEIRFHYLAPCSWSAS